MTPAKFGEAWKMVIPSQAWKQEGVETRRQAPYWGEGIVQPTNPKGAAKAVVGCITGRSLVRIQVGPHVGQVANLPHR